MKIEYFLESLKKDLEIESIEKFSLDTDIVQIDEWDSLTLLVFINHIKLNFELEISVEDIGESFTINDIIKLIEKKTNIKFIN